MSTVTTVERHEPAARHELINSAEYLRDFVGKKPVKPLEAANKCMLMSLEQQDSALRSLTIDDEWLTEAEIDCARGILEEIEFTSGFIDNQIELVAGTDIDLYESLRADPYDKANTQIWAQNLPPSQISDLLDFAEMVDQKTIVLYAVNLLDKLENAPYKSHKAYQAAFEAETIIAPVCKMIGMDGLSSALQNKVDCMTLINTGEGHWVDQAQAKLSEYIGVTDGCVDYNYTKAIAGDCVEASVGEATHNLVFASDSKHGVVLGTGETPDGNRVEWRLKTVGSFAKRLKRTFEDSAEQLRKDTVVAASLRASMPDSIVKFNPDFADLITVSNLPSDPEASQTKLYDDTPAVEMPPDPLGFEYVYEDEKSLAKAYADMTINLIQASYRGDEGQSQFLTLTEGPIRTQPFHVRNSPELVELIKTHLKKTLSDDEIDTLFQFQDAKDSGFCVAKATGYSGKRSSEPLLHNERVGYWGFEIQMTTTAARVLNRIGEQGHLYYKRAKIAGEREAVTEDMLTQAKNIYDPKKKSLHSDELKQGSIGHLLIDISADSMYRHQLV